MEQKGREGEGREEKGRKRDIDSDAKLLPNRLNR